MCGLLQSASGFQQKFSFVTNGNAAAEPVVLTEQIHDLIGQMVHVHDHIVDVIFGQITDISFQYGLSVYGCQRFGGGICKGAQAGSHTCRQDHCFHLLVSFLQSQFLGNVLFNVVDFDFYAKFIMQIAG